MGVNIRTKKFGSSTPVRCALVMLDKPCVRQRDVLPHSAAILSNMRANAVLNAQVGISMNSAIVLVVYIIHDQKVADL